MIPLAIEPQAPTALPGVLLTDFPRELPEPLLNVELTSRRRDLIMEHAK
jgi:hypothetical protein